MGEVRLVWPDPWHADALVALMRPEDRAAFAALGAADQAAERTDDIKRSASVAAVIKAGVAASVYAWCAVEGDDPLCIGGVVPEAGLLGDVGRPWMVSQPGLARHPKRLLRESRARLVALRGLYPVLSNFVSCDYPKSLRWLAWLGFEVGPEEIVLGTRVRRVTL